MKHPDPSPVFVDEDGTFVFEDGTPVPDHPVTMRRALVGVMLTLALVIVIPLMVGFAAYRNIVNDQLGQNEDLIHRVSQERISRTKAINEFIYEQCVQAETRDVVIVKQLRLALQRARATLPAGSPELLKQEQSILDGINDLEPENEADCRPPPAVKTPASKPKGQNP